MAFVAGKEWKGICGELKLGQKIGAVYSDWAEWMQFKVYAILSGNGFVKLFIFSTFSTLLVALGAWLLKKVDPLDESPWSDQLFKAYSLLNNVCGASAVDEDKPPSLSLQTCYS